MSSVERRPVKWSAESIDDLTAAWNYLAADASPAIADCRDRSELRRGVRSISVPPYLIFYRAPDFSIEIVRVLHGRRDIGAIFKNDP